MDDLTLRGKYERLGVSLKAYMDDISLHFKKITAENIQLEVQSIMASALSSDAGAQAANLALGMGSNAADAISLAAELGEELPFISPVLKTLTAIREKVETVKSNREELKALEVSCEALRWARKDVEGVEGLQRQGRDRWTEALVDRVAGGLSLAGIAVIEGKTDDMKAMLQEALTHLKKTPAKLANVPRDTPARKSWHVERSHVIESVNEVLRGDSGPCLVGLVGGSGSGKTTAASEIVRRIEVRETFSDGIVWLSVNQGANTRLPGLMLELARIVYEEVDGSVGHRPEASDDVTAYIKQRMSAAGGAKCLMVADNVWETEVVAQLLEIGMWILLSTRDEKLVTDADGEAVGVDELSEADAESVLRRAAELPTEMRLPDDAKDLIELCGRVAMDLAFVGRWSTVRGRQDRKAWSGATQKVRREISEVGCDPGNETPEETRTKRRKAILRAGFEDIAVGSDDERVQRLYISLAMMPNGHPFTVKEAAVLLYDGIPSAEDQVSAGGVVGVLERWSIVRSTGNAYRMHDAHSNFARENLLDRRNVRRSAVKMWVKYISSLDALRSFDRYALKGLWLAVEGVGGDGWDKTRPYEASLAEMDESDPLLRESIEAVGWFQELQENLEGAYTTFRRLLEIEKRELGADHPFVLNSYQTLGSWADRLGNVDESAEWRKKELEGLPLALGKVKRQLDGDGAEEFDGMVLRSVASTIVQLTPDDRDEAEKLLRRSLTIEEPKLGREDVQVAYTLQHLGVCVREAGRLEEADHMLRRCLSIKEAKLGPGDIEVAYTLQHLGVCVREAGRQEEAEELLRRCLSIKEAKLGREDVQVAYTLQHLGVCVRQARRLEEAEELLRRCLSICEAKLGPGDTLMAHTLYWLGVCLRAAGRLEEAEGLLRRCLNIEEAQPILKDVDIARTLHQLSLCVREAGRPREAKDMLRRVLAIVDTKLGKPTADTPDRQARKYSRQQEWLEKAKKCLKECLAIDEAELGCNRRDTDKGLQELGAFLREVGKLN
eukprot:g17347.t1